jgi:hypothetical protein
MKIVARNAYFTFRATFLYSRLYSKERKAMKASVMVQRYVIIGIMLLCLLISGGIVAYAEEEFLLCEEFNSLEHWELFHFPNIDVYSTYTILDGGILELKSHASASAIVYKDQFDVYDYPYLEWRWKAVSVYEKGDAMKRSGDDYPLRIYITFQYDPKRASVGKRLKYHAAKLLYGEYPPHSSLNYIWSNKEYDTDIITSTYAEESQMIAVQQGTALLNTWQVNRVNLLHDYRRAFGEDPPEMAGIFIMNDSDATKESS